MIFFIFVTFSLIGLAWTQEKMMMSCEKAFIEVNGREETKIISDEI
ncbi:MAG: hypothetical protein ACMUEM_00325 [Flavobacteriales bacterium AspAUS03]